MTTAPADRPRRGRPTLGTTRTRDVRLSLTDEQVEQLREIGGGSASAGVRVLLFAYTQETRRSHE